MAQMTTTVDERAAQILVLPRETWGILPQVEAHIDSWDWVDQVVFIEEWPLTEALLRELEEYAAAGTLTPLQVREYGELQQIVTRNRPGITRLQAS